MAFLETVHAKHLPPYCDIALKEKEHLSALFKI